MLANLFLSAYQKKMARQLNTVVGREMLQGIESAKGNPAPNWCWLTARFKSLSAAYGKKLGLWGKIKLFYSFPFFFRRQY